MTSSDIARLRLRNQHISQPRFTKPSDVVHWLGAVQAQDYPAAKWAVAQRTTGVTEAVLERAFDAGAILRTHLLRPTWHFVTPAELRWMLALTAPRIISLNAYRCRQLELDQAIFRRSNTALEKAMQGGHQLTHAQLVSVLRRARITDVPLRFGHLMMRAELDGLVCSVARRGKQHTYALLEERVPPARALERGEALAELAARYFASRGPATLQDFVWWSGLTAADARAGHEMLKTRLEHEIVGGKTYWFSTHKSPEMARSRTAHLLPNFDEYVVGYRDRSAVFDPTHTGKLDARENILFTHTIVIDGQIAGTWKRTLKGKTIVADVSPFSPITKEEQRAVGAAAKRYASFLGLPLVLANRRHSK